VYKVCVQSETIDSVNIKNALLVTQHAIRYNPLF